MEAFVAAGAGGLSPHLSQDYLKLVPDKAPYEYAHLLIQCILFMYGACNRRNQYG